MRFSGTVARMNKTGRISLPKLVRKKIDLEPNVEVTLSIEKDMLVIRKHELKCIVTGSTKDVVEVFPGIPLSRRGMEILLEQLIFRNL